MPEARAVRALGEAVQVHGPAVQVRQQHGGHPGGVPDQLALGHRGLAGPGGKQHLLEVGQAQAAAEHVPRAGVGEGVEGGELVLGRREHGPVELDRRLRGRQVRAPEPVRIGLDLVVRAAAEDGARVVLGVPALDGVLVALVQEHPLLRAVPLAAAHEDEPAVELRPVDVRVELAGGDGGRRVVRTVRLPGAPVPDDDVPAAVLLRRDDALEVEVLDRVVLDVDGHPARDRVERRPAGDRPADEDAVDLEAQVVVEAPGAVPLDHEAARGGRRRRPGPARGLGRAVEVPLGAVGLERVGHGTWVPLVGADHPMEAHPARGGSARR